MYRPLWDGVLKALGEIFAELRPADKVIQFHLKANRKWGSHDRRLFAEAVYDLVRWWRKLLWVVNVDWPATDEWDGSRVDVHERVLSAWCAIHDVEVDRSVARPQASPEWPAKWRESNIPRAVLQSVPDWLDQLGFEELGENWNEILPVLNTVAPVYLRANRLLTTPENLARELKEEKIEAEVLDGDALKLRRRTNVFLTKSFKAGHFEVQDLSSQQVAPLLAPEPGQRVVDACAGAGGKTLHLAALMKNKGKIIALDPSEKKLVQLRERSTRAKAMSIEIRPIESAKTIKRLADSADRVLLDVPCSGMGVLRRNPDSKWKMRPADLTELRATQADILARYSTMCRAGGALVYATCSILPSENERQVEKFLSQFGTRWDLESEKTFLPEASGRDGFFMARLRRRPT